MSVNVRFTTDVKDYVAGQEKMTKAADEGREALRKQAREAAELEKTAKKVFRETATEAEKYEKELEQLNRALRAGKISQDQYNRALDQTNDKYGQTDKSFRSLLAGAPAKMATMAAGWFGVAEAVQFASEAMQVYEQNSREAADATESVLKQFRGSLGGLGSGEERIDRLRQIRLASGGELSDSQLDSVIQSLIADVNTPLADIATEVGELADAIRAGLDPDAASGIASTATALGVDQSDLAALILAGAQAGTGSVSDLSGAAPSLAAYDNRTFGVAVAAALAGFAGSGTGTATEQVAIGLSPIDDARKQLFEQLGVINGTREQRLKALADAGFDTQEKLIDAGIRDQGAALRVSQLIQTMKSGALAQIQSTLGTVAQDPAAYIASQRARQSDIEQLQQAGQAALNSSQVIKSTDRAALTTDLRRRLLAAELERRGVGQFGRVDLIEDGRATLEGNSYAKGAAAADLALRASGFTEMIRQLGERSGLFPLKDMAESNREASKTLREILGELRTTKPPVPEPEA